MSRNSEISRAQDTEGVLCQTHVGGQALLEGVMMRGKHSWAVAVRTPDGGIHTEEHDLPAKSRKHGWLNRPIARGCRALVESLLLGFKALDIASEYAFDDEEEEERVAPEGEGDPVVSEDGDEGKLPRNRDIITVSGFEAAFGFEDASGTDAALDESAPEGEDMSADHASESKGSSIASASSKDGGGGNGAVLALGTVLGVVLAIALFVMLPAAASNLIVGDYDSSPLLWNVVDGVLRVTIFVCYIWLISRMAEIKRMFRYHGAEHKTIHCYEHGLPLTPENASRFPTLHIRCGTAFLIMTMIIAIVVFSLVPIGRICDVLGIYGGLGKFAVLVLSRIVLIPLIAGIGYEITVKWAGSRPDNPLVRVILWPGLQMQRLTTGEPDDSMLECAIAAMELVLRREAKEEGREYLPSDPLHPKPACPKPAGTD